MNMLARRETGMEGGLQSFDGLMKAMFNHLGMTPGRLFETPFESRLEINVKDDAVEAKMPCAGCGKSDFDIEVVGNFLTVKVKRSSGEKEDGGGGKKHYISRERSFEEYSESVKLPVAVKCAEAAAKYVDGVLEISIPREKEEKTAPRSIKVQ